MYVCMYIPRMKTSSSLHTYIQVLNSKDASISQEHKDVLWATKAQAEKGVEMLLNCGTSAPQVGS